MILDLPPWWFNPICFESCGRCHKPTIGERFEFHRHMVTWGWCRVTCPQDGELTAFTPALPQGRRRTGNLTKDTRDFDHQKVILTGRKKTKKTRCIYQTPGFAFDGVFLFANGKFHWWLHRTFEANATCGHRLGWIGHKLADQQKKGSPL